jgi:nucleotide-binding universal stress UspA family protein
MKTILVPVDGSDSSTRALKVAVSLLEQRPDAILHVINVQAPIISGNVKRFFSADAINDYYQDCGQTAMVPAKAMLDAAGVAYQEKTVVGHVAPTIADFVKQHGCEHIVMGTRGLGSVSGLVLGSVTTKVLTLVDVPVTLVK